VLSYGLPECIEKVVEASKWDEKRAARSPKPGAPKRGLGVACSHYVSGAANSIIRSDMPHSTVNIKVDRDGGVVAYTGASEIGQGSDTMTAQVIAEILGCRVGRVRVIAADTDLTPIDLGSYSSRVTMMAGNAALRAAEDIRKKITASSAQKLNCAPEDVVFGHDMVWRKGVTPPVAGGADAAGILEAKDTPRGNAEVKVQGRVEGQILRGALQQKRKEEGPKDWMSFEEAVVGAIDFSGALTGTGSYAPSADARGGKHKGGGVGPSPAYSYSAQVAEVSVDEETGEVTVHKIWAAHDCGRALNPVAVEGQVIGSVWMGLGQALQEEMVWKDGLLMNPGMLEYRSPSSAESPEIECFIVESIDPEGPFGAKEAGEGSLAATIPVISNAIYDAIGIRLREAPFTPERILAAIRDRDAKKKINMTEGIDPTAPARLREHGGSLWFNGKGPSRHPLDPARTQPPAGGDD
jgi:4-hydroxybenzoyl-CoA reductase subunit alpha